MATQFDTQLQQLYVAYFNRPADPDGLAFYAGHLTTGATTLAAISASFAASAEYRAEYNQVTNAGVVTAVYQNLFGHAPDAAGLAFYTKALDDRTMTVDTMVTWIANGAQSTDKVAYDSKVNVAVAFTNALDTAEEKAGYNVPAAQEAAKEMLAGITTAAQATTAIAGIDAQVDAVIDAGVPFSLQTGLAALDASQKAIADFLEENELEAAEVATNVTEAEDAIGELVADPLYGTTTNAGVKAALLAAQVEQNAADLEAANEVATDAREAVASVKGLDNAIAAATSADEAVTDAEEALAAAATNAASAQSNLTIRNTTLTVAANTSLEAGNLRITDGAKVVAEIVDGELVLAKDITAAAAAKYTGLTAFITAGNEYLSAEADLEGAQDAELLANLQVEMLDRSAGSLSATTFTFIETKPAVAATPTYAEVLDELSARTAKGTDAALVSQINAFINLNTTERADDLMAAEKGTLGVAQDRVAAIEGLTEAAAAAEASQKALDTATTAATAAATKLDTESTSFETANTGLTVNANGTVTDVIVLNTTTNQLELATSSITEQTNPGVTALLAAGNANLTAQATLTAATDVDNAADQTLAGIDGGADALKAVADAEAIVANPAATEAQRVEVLGTAGAQAAIDALTEAQDDLEAAQAIEAQYESLIEARDAAIAKFEANDFNEPQMLDGVTAFGRTGSDIFVVGEADTVSITNFGRSGDDVLFVGSGYTLNEGDVTKDGVATALEVFFTQRGNNTIVTIETEAYGSNANTDLVQITLTGVDADDLTFANGIISM